MRCQNTELAVKSGYRRPHCELLLQHASRQQILIWVRLPFNDALGLANNRAKSHYMYYHTEMSPGHHDAGPIIVR